MEFKAVWTGGHQSLCVGEWKLYRKYEDYLEDGTKDIGYDDISNLIPEELRHEPMYTDDLYNRWYFDENYHEEFETYQSGFDCEDWCNENEWWIHLICDPKDYKALYNAFNEHDWRYESCGGCI